MPEYHFVPEIPETNRLPANRLTARYERKKFNRAKLIQAGEVVFVLQNCLGSLILVDRVRKGLNKLHIGELQIRNPHIERYDSKGKAGPRIDLNRIDIRYAQERLEELKRWKEPVYREGQRKRLDDLGWYSIPHRLNQLDISNAGLEIKINLMRDLIAYLDKRKDKTFVSEKAREIEYKSGWLIKFINGTHSEFSTYGMTKKERRKPKLIAKPEFLQETGTIHDLVQEVFEFAVTHENFDPQRATNYWENVDSWGECRVGDYIFTRYDADFWHHLRRHFPRSDTPGSKFGVGGRIPEHEFFSTPRGVIDFAWQELRKRGYKGKKTTIELDFEQPIGLEGIIALSDLPPGTEVKQETRDGKHEIQVVSGILKTPTNHLVIIAGPLESGRHGFTSMYPGAYCPDIDENPGFWENHAFLA